MNFFSLASDIQKEIRQYLNVESLINLYEAYFQSPSQELVTYEAISRHLPDAKSFYQLLSFEEMSLQKRIEHCIDTYDIPSFARLIGEVEELSLHKYANMWKKRPKLAAQYYLERIKRNIATEYDFDIVIASRDMKLLRLYLRNTCVYKLPKGWLNFLDTITSYTLEICQTFAEFEHCKYVWEHILNRLLNKNKIEERKNIYLQLIDLAINNNGAKGTQLKNIIISSNIDEAVILPRLSSENVIHILLRKNFQKVKYAYNIARKLNLLPWDYIQYVQFGTFVVMYIEDGLVTLEEVYSRISGDIQKKVYIERLLRRKGII